MTRTPSISSFVLVVSVLGALLGCSGSSAVGARTCALEEIGKRPAVQLTWEIAHTNMDDDPPRPKVALLVKGSGNDERIEIGELAGVCRLVELGAQPDEPVYGGGVSELACDHQGLAMHVRVVQAAPQELIVRRYEKDGASTEGASSLKNVRDLKTVPVPACARFSSELSHPGDL